MTELEMKELRRILVENGSCKEEERKADDTGNNLEEEVRNILTALEADEEIGNLVEKEVATIKEIAEALEQRQKDKLLAFRDVPKKKLLEETAKVDKVLRKVKTHSITKTNELFYAGAIQELLLLQIGREKRLIRQQSAEGKEPMWRRRLQNKIKELRKDLSQFESSKDKEVSNVRH